MGALFYTPKQNVVKKLKRKTVNLLIVLFNILFLLIWGVLAWGESELWSFLWTFDAVGHFAFCFVWGFIFLYWIKTYWRGAYVVVPKWAWALTIIAFVTTVIEVIVWEILIEWLLWDSWLQPAYFHWLAKAQKGSEDTILDIVVSLLGAVFAMLAWWASRKFYAWKWPNEDVEEEIEEARERNEVFAEEINAMQKEHRKQVIAKIKAPWEKLFTQE